MIQAFLLRKRSDQIGYRILILRDRKLICRQSIPVYDAGIGTAIQKRFCGFQI